MRDLQPPDGAESLSLADAARKLCVSKDRFYGLCEGMDIHPMQTTGGLPGSKGGKPPVLLLASEVEAVRVQRLKYRRKAGRV